METARQQKTMRMGRGMSSIGALIIVAGILFARDFVEGIGVGVGVSGLIMIVSAWRGRV
jgi:hypothetical protein